MSHYDLIVLGTGGVGSAALFHAAGRGLKVLGLDRFAAGHNRGSSHGESRMIRMSYFEHPDYVPLLRRSYELWDELDAGLLQRCGVLYVGDPEGPTLAGVKLSAERHGLHLETPGPGDFPFSIPAGAQAIFEPDAGQLPVEQCVISHVDQAMDAGAEHRFGEEILEWSETRTGIRVETESEEFSADRLIIAAGAWSSEVMANLNLPLQVLRKHLHWYQTDATAYDSGFFFELEDGQFYGFPARDGRLKLGEHSGGEVVNDPLGANRAPDKTDNRRVEAFVEQCLPGVSLTRMRHETCFYTMTPDGQFIVDQLPGNKRIAFAAGLSGHGFKFTPVLGEILVDLVTEGGTGFDVNFLGLRRPELAEDC